MPTPSFVLFLFLFLFCFALCRECNALSWFEKHKECDVLVIGPCEITKYSQVSIIEKSLLLAKLLQCQTSEQKQTQGASWLSSLNVNKNNQVEKEALCFNTKNQKWKNVTLSENVSTGGFTPSIDQTGWFS